MSNFVFARLASGFVQVNIKGQTTFIYIFKFSLKNDRGTLEQQLDFIMVAFLQVGVVNKHSRPKEITTIFAWICYKVRFLKTVPSKPSTQANQ